MPKKKDYILLRSVYRQWDPIKKWVRIKSKKQLDSIISECDRLNIDYIILFNFENKWIDNNDYFLGGCYLLDKVWKKLFEDHKEVYKYEKL